MILFNSRSIMKGSVLWKKIIAIAIVGLVTTIVHAEIIDSHIHLFSPKNGVNDPITAKDVIALLDDGKVDRAVVLSAAYWFNDLDKARVENDFVANEVAKYPSRLMGFCAVQPMQSWALKEFERCIKVLKLRGLKLHPQFNKLDLRDSGTLSKIDELLKKAGELNVPVILDSVGWDAKEVFNFLELAFKNPTINIILAHAFLNRFRDMGILVTLYESNPSAPRNIYVDLSAIGVLYSDSPDRDVLLWHLRKLGMDHVLFGSDYPVFTPKKTLKALNHCGFTKAESNGLFGNNAARLLKVQ